MHHRGSPDAAGTIRLSLPTLHTGIAPGDTAPTPYLAGTFTLQLYGWLGRAPVKDRATVFVAPDGQVALRLAVGGDCGDCGDVELRGRLVRDVVRGSWSQEFLGEEPHGSFELRRLP